MAYDSWQPIGRAGKMRFYQLTLTADGTDDLPMEDIMGGYIMPLEYLASGDDAIVITLKTALGVDILNGNGTVADATTGGYISPNDRWPISSTLTYDVSGLSESETVTFRFHVVNE